MGADAVGLAIEDALERGSGSGLDRIGCWWLAQKALFINQNVQLKHARPGQDILV
jgi:hypothetical protein